MTDQPKIEISSPADVRKQYQLPFGAFLTLLGAFLAVFEMDEWSVFCFPAEGEVGRSDECGDVGCLHSTTTELEGVIICSHCGVEVSVELDHEPEWKKGGITSSRCRFVSRIPRTLEDLTRKIGLSEAVALRVEEKYRKVVGERTVRGNSRTAIVAACLLYVFMDLNQSRSPGEIAEMLNLDLKHFNPGMTAYYAAFPDDRTRHLTPTNLLHRVMVAVSLPGSSRIDGVEVFHLTRLEKMIAHLSGSALLKRSNPWSIAAAIVALYLETFPSIAETISYDVAHFAKSVSLSLLTLTKLSREAGELLGLKKKR